MAQDIDLKYVASVLGTTNFKIIDGKTKIIMMDTNRQFSRRLKREMERQPKEKLPKYARIKRDFSIDNFRASVDALSKEEQKSIGFPDARIIKKA